MNLSCKNALEHRRVTRDEGERAPVVGRPDDAERARIIFEGTTQAQNTALLKLFHVGKVSRQRLL